MTTILKALQQLEAGEAPSERAIAATSRTDQRRRLPLVVALLLSLVGGALGLVWFVGGRKADSPAPVVEPRLASQPVAQVPRPLSTSANNEPWGRVEEGQRAALSSAGTHVAGPAAAPHPRKAPSQESATTAHAYVPGEHPVKVQSIAYSQNPARRTVTLLVEDAHAVTLHEGESANGIEVQLILPDTVYLRQGPTVFAVSGGR